MLVLLLIAVTSTWAGNIQIAATQNGTVTTTVDDVIVTEAAAGTTVTINVTPADGYVLKDGQLTIQEYVNTGSAHAPRKAPSLSAPQTLTVNAEGKVTFEMPENNVYISGATFISTAPVEFDKWVVAGSSAALNGKSWDKAATENLMTTTDGKNYELVVTDAVLEKGTNYECKVVLQPTKENPTDDDYIWRPYNNVVFTTGEAETGKYTVTYTYVAPDNIETEEGTLTVATVRTGDADPVEKTYTVAGDSEALFGSTWSAASEANDMVANPEVENEYVFEKENVTLTAGTILYKVVENHSWDVSYPTNNASLVIAADGTYNVKFTFNSETKAVNGTATAVTPPAPEIDKLYVIGDGTTNGWDRTAMDEMTWNEETQAFTYEYAPTNEMNYIAIADYQMTADEATADENWSVFNTHRYLIANIDGSPTLNTEYDLTKGDGSIILAKGTYTISITKGLKITITGEVAPPPAEDTYVVAGNGPATNGVEWDATAEVNKMTTEDNDTYTLVVENAELAADGIYTWKVVKNGSIWIPDGMDNDLTVDIAEDGIYTVTYKYVVSTGEETAVAEKTGDIPVEHQGTKYESGDHAIWIQANHYVAEDKYELIIESDEEMEGLGGSFWTLSSGNADLRDNIAISEDKKTIIITATSTTEPVPYTPLYIMMPGEVNFGQIEYQWVDIVPPSVDKLYVIGDGTTNGWDRTAMDEMTWNEETQAFTYEYAPTNEMNYIAIADYQMTADEATADENWSVFNTHRYLIANIDGSPTLNTEYDLTKGDGSIILAKGTYTISITKGLKITITGEVAPPPAEDTYVVAGNGPATNGVEWDATAEVNKMTTEDNDTYTLVVENAELAADGIYTWKVVKNGSIWIPDGMGNDLKLDIAEDGIYTVTYKYVVSTGEETAEAVKTGDIPVVVTTWTVAGASVRDAAAGANDILFGLTWDATATDNDMVKGNDGLWTLKKASVALTTNNVITFKVYKNHAFDESYPEENMTCEVTANSVYDVTFTFNEETKVVTVQLTDVAPVTGISAIQTEALNGNVYNMNGQRVNNVNQKGVYIMNGRKVLVK